jgi:heme/copper-type cytochrome/quinol oxidase subunit 4
MSAPGADTYERARRAMALGTAVFVALIVLDTIEFAVSQLASQLLLWMALLAIPQAGLILWFYMHLGQLWRREEH